MSNALDHLKTRVILELTKDLAQADSASIPDLITKSLGSCAPLLKANRAFIFLLDELKQQFSVAFEWKAAGLVSVKKSLQNLPFTDYALWGKFADHAKPFQVSDTENIPDIYAHDNMLFREISCKAFVQKPFTQKNQVTGFISFSSSQRGIHWNEEDQEFLSIIAELIQALLQKYNPSEEPFTLCPKESSPPEVSAKPATEVKTREIYTSITENLSFGSALFNTEKNQFVFVNPKLAEFFQLSTHRELLNREIFRYFKKGGYNPADFFAPDTRQNEKDFSLKVHNRVLNGYVNPVKNSPLVILTVFDISPFAFFEQAEKKFNKQLRVLSEAAIELMTTKHEDLFSFIGEVAYTLLDDPVVIVNQYHKEEGFLQTVYVKGMSLPVKTIAQLLGKHPLHKKYPLEVHGEPYQALMDTRISEVTGGIEELALGTVAAPVASKIEKILQVQRFYSCGLHTHNQLYGTMSLLLRSKEDPNFYILETFTRMVSNALHAHYISEQLHKTTQILSEATKIARIGYWQYDMSTQKLTISKQLFKSFNNLEAESSQDLELPMDHFLKKYVRKEDVYPLKEKLNLAQKNRHIENYTIDLEWTLKRPHQSPLQIYTRGVVQNNNIITGIAQDITLRRRAEKNLWESESKFLSLIGQSHDGIIIIQDDGLITEWNVKAEEITGYTAQMVSGKYAWDIESEVLFDPALRRKHPQQPRKKLQKKFFDFFKTKSQKAPFSTSITIKTRSGELKHLAISSFIFKADQHRYLCLIIKDTTVEQEKREKEKQQEISHKTAQAKELFLDNMSHEMRTPLSGIIGMTDMLSHTPLNTQQAEMLKVVKESSDSLLELVSNIHEISRIDIDRIVLYDKVFDPGLLLERTASIFRASALQKSITLEVQNAIPESIRLTGDEFRLHQVLTNLIANAIKFTPGQGRITLKAHVRYLDSQRVELTLKIQDTGIGIAPEKIPYIFDKFVQADASYTRAHDGAGIGLYICRELIERMGGKIGLHSKLDQGSEFWIRLTFPFEEEHPSP